MIPSLSTLLSAVTSHVNFSSQKELIGRVPNCVVYQNDPSSQIVFLLIPALDDGSFLGHFHVFHTLKRKDDIPILIGSVVLTEDDDMAFGDSICTSRLGRTVFISGTLVPPGGQNVRSQDAGVFVYTVDPLHSEVYRLSNIILSPERPGLFTYGSHIKCNIDGTSILIHQKSFDKLPSRVDFWVKPKKEANEWTRLLLLCNQLLSETDPVEYLKEFFN